LEGQPGIVDRTGQTDMIRRNWIYSIIRPFIRPEFLEDIEGDLKELYESTNATRQGLIFHLKFSFEVFKLLRLELINIPFNVVPKLKLYMIPHYFKVAFRSLLKNKLTSFVSLAGLSLGLACVMLAYLYVSHHTGFDDFHTRKDRIFRVVNGDMDSGEGWVKIAAPLLPQLKETIPEIESFTRFEPISRGEKVLIESENKKFNEPYFVMVDPAFFEIFDFPLLIGDKSLVLNEPGNVVITKRIREKLFGAANPIGKVIRADETHEFIVSGVIENPLLQSHLRYDFLISFENLKNIYGENSVNSWGAYNYFGYILLNEKADPFITAEKIRDFSVTTDRSTFNFDQVNLQSLSAIHFQHNRGNLLPGINPVYLWIFASISLIVLIIALANYVNLSIALSIRRAREYGVRKALGAARENLIIQFFSETLIAMFISLMLAALFIYAVLPPLNAMLGTSMTLKFDKPEFWFALTGIVTLATILASSYLAIIVSAFNPVTILKGNIKVKKGSGLQNILLGIQFLLSIVLLINTFIITDQLNYIKTRSIGMVPDGVVNIPLYNKLDSVKLNTLKNELLKVSGVTGVSASTFVPGSASWHQTVSWEGQTPEEQDNAQMYLIATDKDFMRTLGLELVYGNLEDIENSSTPQIKYIINESGMKFLGWEDPGERKLSPFGPGNYGEIAGVVKDFNFRSLHSGMDPLLLAVSDRFFHEQLSIKLQIPNLTSSLKDIEKTFVSVSGGLPFEYFFLNDKIEQLYQTENETGKLIFYSTLFALLLATMGLFGIISFMIEDKTKEIAIRKILGISFFQMIFMFSKRYLLVLSVAIVFAWPLSWFVMNNWLNNFAYRTGLDFEPFVIGGAVAFLMIIGVVGIKMFTIKNLDPAKALKQE
jgi:putative ABC transport system permease protein